LAGVIPGPEEWPGYVGLRPRWVIKDLVAVSPMPAVNDLDKLARFRTVYSLATPAEYAYGAGIDPRSLQAVIENYVWTPVGEYNAPTLPELARAVDQASGPAPVLIHCLRGCGRSPTAAAAWLIRHRGSKLSESLATVSQAVGCGPETWPQRSVLEAYATAVTAGVLEAVKSSDVDDPRPEYSLLIASRLAGLAGVDPLELARNVLSSPEAPVARAAAALAEGIGYTLSRIEASRQGGEPRLLLEAWIPRRAHPANIRRPVEPPSGLAERLEKELGELVPGLKIELRARGPRDVPWL